MLFSVKNNNIINLRNKETIDNLSIIFNEELGTYKYGESNLIDEIYKEINQQVITAEGFNKETFLKIDLYKFDLTNEEICIFANYFIEVSANINNNLEMIAMLNNDIENLKVRLKYLKSIGF